MEGYTMSFFKNKFIDLLQAIAGVALIDAFFNIFDGTTHSTRFIVDCVVFALFLIGSFIFKYRKRIIQ